MLVPISDLLRKWDQQDTSEILKFLIVSKLIQRSSVSGTEVRGIHWQLVWLPTSDVSTFLESSLKYASLEYIVTQVNPFTNSWMPSQSRAHEWLPTLVVLSCLDVYSCMKVYCLRCEDTLHHHPVRDHLPPNPLRIRKQCIQTYFIVFYTQHRGIIVTEIRHGQSVQPQWCSNNCRKHHIRY